MPPASIAQLRKKLIFHVLEIVPLVGESNVGVDGPVVSLLIVLHALVILFAKSLTEPVYL